MLEGVVTHLSCLPQTAIEGTLNVVRQAEKAGITKVVVTGTFGNTIDRKSFNDRITNETG